MAYQLLLNIGGVGKARPQVIVTILHMVCATS